MTKPQYEVVFEPTQEDLACIDRGLHEFNLECLGEQVIYNYHRVVILAKDQAGNVIGGVHGELCWDWLYIKALWVRRRHRGQGIGTRLLREIERAAVSKGFYKSHLETTDFQALGFYVKRGYEVFGELDGKPAGSTWYYVKRFLTEDRQGHPL